MVQIIANDDGTEAVSLAAKLEALSERYAEKKFIAFVIVNNADPNVLGKLAGEKGIQKVNVGYLKNGRDSARSNVFAALKINPEARNTVLVYKRKTVASNLVNVRVEDFEKIEKAIEEMLQ